MIHIPAISYNDMVTAIGASVARIANGNYTKAIQIQQQSGNNQEFFEWYRNLMLAVVRPHGVLDLKQWAEALNERGREEIKNFLNYAQHLTRECFISQLGQTDLNYLDVHEQDFAPKFARFLTVENIEFIIDTFTKAYNDIEQNGNGKIVLFHMGLQLKTKIR